MLSDRPKTRREFLKKAALGSLMAVSLPQLVAQAYEKGGAEGGKTNITLQKGDIILFQGDSITDADRQPKEKQLNHGRALGNGYVTLTVASLLQAHPDRELTFYNRGVSGDKVNQLNVRWETDCLQISPSVLSILVGVNDFWHVRKHGYQGTDTTYQDAYRELLERTLARLPQIRLLIGEPFAMQDTSVVDQTWFPAFTAYQQAARTLAEEFGAVFIPYQTIFQEALTYAPSRYWTVDGVHPTLAGAQLMAIAWQKAVS